MNVGVEHTVEFYGRGEKDLLPFFTENRNLVFCNYFGNLLKKIGFSEYNQSELCLFINSLKHSLKCLVLISGNKYGFIPNAHSIMMNTIVQGTGCQKHQMCDLCRL